MIGSGLEAVDFAAYPPLAKDLATEHLSLLKRLPPVFGALFLSEVIGYDWRFPAERAEIGRQLAFLGGRDEARFTTAMIGFAELPLSPELREKRWAAAPAEFIERFTAYLWSVHAMDQFREVAAEYQRALLEARPEPLPGIPRLCVVVVGQGATPGTLKLFQKLRPQGTYFSRVKSASGLDDLFLAMQARSKAHPEPYGHWYVDGGPPYPAAQATGLRTISYERLAPVRRALLKRVGTVRDTGDGVGPESLRSLLASLTPEQLGTGESSGDAVQRRFELSLLTEGSGTQIFSTTFVQWAGRELLRRARPLTLMLRYAPRQAERAMDQLLRVDAAEPSSEPSSELKTDAAGSLLDADMGAYYTWVNLQRLTGAEQASFVVWFEGGQEALAAGPAMARNAESKASCDVGQIIKWLA